jgi:hypothetical protein
MGGKQTRSGASSSSRPKGTRQQKAVASACANSSQKKTRTVEVSLSAKSKRVQKVVSSTRPGLSKPSKPTKKSLAAKTKLVQTPKKNSSKAKSRTHSLERNSEHKALDAKAAASKKSATATLTKKSIHTSSKSAQTKSAGQSQKNEKSKMVGKQLPVVAAGASMPNNDRKVPSLIPAPTQEVLKPFRDAAKRTKKLIKDKQKALKSRGDFIAKQNKKGRKYKIDLRVHTPGSYGFFSTGGVDPAPALVRLARVKGLDMIGVTDYYNAAYIDQVRAQAEGTKIVVLPGFDMCCRVGICDQITAIALFPPDRTSIDIQAALDELKVPVSAYGRPDYILEVDFSTVVDCVERRGGIIIPSRVDKTPFRRLAIPDLVESFGFHAFDLVHTENPDFFREKWPSGGFTFFSFSNANALGQVGTRSATVRLNSPGFDGLKELVARRPNIERPAEAA